MIIDQDFGDGEEYKIEINHDDSGPFTHIAHYPIKSGPQTFKSVNIFSIDGKDDDDPERFKINFSKASRSEPERYLKIKQDSEFECKKDEVIKLLDLLDNFYELEGLDRGDHVIIRKNSPSSKAAASAVEAIKNCESEVEKILLGLIGSINDMDVSPSDLDLSDDKIESEAIKAEYSIKHARTRKKLEEFDRKVDDCLGEQKYQQFLEDNPWIFGHQYIERINIRELTKGDELDFCMKSADGYYDVIEIKTPDKTVMVEDTSHGTYKASSKLSEAIAQIQDYIHSIERNEAEIKIEEDIHAVKPRGIIVIGNNINEEKRNSLRVLNSHLNRIQIYTFSDISEMGSRLVDRYDDEGLPTKSISTTD
jgi:hypothetical protein